MKTEPTKPDDSKARNLYGQWITNPYINRLSPPPTWDELSESVRSQWRIDAGRFHHDWRAP